MASRVDRPVRFFGVLDRRWAPEYLDETLTTATESGPRPGTAATEDDADLVPQVIGGLGAPIEVVCTQAGFPRYDEGVGVGFYRPAESEVLATDLRGWEPPNRIVDWIPPQISASLVHVASIARLTRTQRALAVWGNSAGSVAFGGTWDPVAHAWAAWGSTPAYGALVEVPGRDRVLLITADGTVRRTDDAGATWQGHARSTLLGSFAAAAAGEPHRAAMDGQGSILFGAISGGTLYLFATADQGGSWVAVATIAAAVSFDIAPTPDGGLWFAVTTAAEYYAVRIGGAFEDPTNADPVHDGSVGGLPEGVNLVVSHDGSVRIQQWDGADWYYLEWNPTSNTTRANPGELLDGGAVGPGYHSAAVEVAGYTLWATVGTVAVPRVAGSLIFGGWAGPVFDNDGGGWGSASNWQNRRAWGLYASAWFGYQRPEDFVGPYTLGGTGGTSTLNLDGSMTIATAAASRFYAMNPTTFANAQGAAEFAIRANSVAAANTTGVHLNVSDGSGTGAYSVWVFVETDGYRVWDLIAAAWLGPKVAIDLTEKTLFRLQSKDGTVRVLTRPAGPTTLWTEGGTWSAATGGAGAATFALTFGVLIVGTSNVDFWYCQGGQSFDPVIDYAAPEVLAGYRAWGRSAVLPYPLPPETYPPSGAAAFLRLRGGPGAGQETWTHDVLYDYPIEALFSVVEPSPTIGWRSAVKGVAQRVVLDFEHDARPGESWSVAMVVRAANVRRVRLLADGATLGTLDLATGFAGVSYVLSGVQVGPTIGGGAYAGTAGARYIGANELAGGTVILDLAGTPKPRRILRNTAGFWSGADGPRALLELDPAYLDGTEAASGTCDLCWPSGVLVVHSARAVASQAQLWGVEIPSTEIAADPEYRIGGADLVGLRPPGKQWAVGWTWDATPNVRSDRDRYGTDRRERLGPLARRVAVSWDHGARLGIVRSGVTDADWIAPVGGAPLVGRDDVWSQIVGVYQDSDDGARPALLLSVDPGSGGTVTDPTLWIWGYLDGGIRVENAIGNEGESEYVRVGPITVSEVV